MSLTPTVRVHNVQTGEVIDREMNDEELAKWEEAQKAIAEEAEKLAAEANAKAALLEKLGITEEEAKLLLK